MKNRQTNDAAPDQAGGKHTSELLHVERDGAECYVTASDAMERFCTMSRPTEAKRLEDARMIVRACNSAPALLAALKGIAATFEQPGWTGTRIMQVQRDTVIKEARAAIALAEK